MKKLLLIFLLIAAWSVQAREVYPLCDDWLFSFRYENSSDNARCVTLPHTWNLDALAGTIPYLRTTADYQRKLYVPQTWTGKRLFLKFYGVESVAHAWANRRLTPDCISMAAARRFCLQIRRSIHAQRAISVPAGILR